MTEAGRLRASEALTGAIPLHSLLTVREVSSTNVLADASYDTGYSSDYNYRVQRSDPLNRPCCEPNI